MKRFSHFRVLLYLSSVFVFASSFIGKAHADFSNGTFSTDAREKDGVGTAHEHQGLPSFSSNQPVRPETLPGIEGSQKPASNSTQGGALAAPAAQGTAGSANNSGTSSSGTASGNATAGFSNHVV